MSYLPSFSRTSDGTSPFTIRAKNISLLTNGSGDIAQLVLPPYVTRYSFAGNANSSSYSLAVKEIATGTHSGALFCIFTMPGGSGVAISRTFNGPTGTSVGVPINAFVGSAVTVYQNNILYINQGSGSENEGRCSFYLTIWPK